MLLWPLKMPSDSNIVSTPLASNCLVYIPRSHHADVRLLALGVPNFCVLLLENVNESPAQLWVEVKVEEMRLCLLLLHDLNARTYRENSVLRKTNVYLGEDAILSALLLVFLLCGFGGLFHFLAGDEGNCLFLNIVAC